MYKDEEFGFTEVNQDFGRTIDTPNINYALALDIDKKVIKIPFSNSFILIDELLRNYTKISSNLKQFKQKPCLRVLQGKKKMQIADPKVQLISFCLNLKEVCFRVEDTAFPNIVASDIVNMLSGEQTGKGKDEKINLTLIFQGKKIRHIINGKQTIKQLKEELCQIIQKQRKTKSENLVLQIEGVVLANDKIIEDSGLENKEIKVYIEKKQGCYRANTLILRSDGTYAQMKSIQVGDSVRTFNRETLELQDRSIISIYTTMIDECVMVKLKNGVQIYTTPNHLFMCEDGAFRLVKSSNPKEMCLKQHDYLRLVTRKTVEVVEIQTKVMSQVFYNVVIENGYNVIINDVISQHFSIKVQGIVDKIVYAIDATPLDSMLKIKLKLQTLLNISLNNLKLVCCAKPLSDQETISDKNFDNQTIINFSKKSVDDHFNAVSLEMPIFCKGAAWLKLNQVAQNQELVYFDTDKNMINNQFALFGGLSPVRVDEFVVITLSNGELKISTDSYLLATNQTVVFVLDLYKAFTKKLHLPELKTADGQKVTIQNIVLISQKTNFNRVKTTAPNIIVSNLIIVKDVINVIIRKSGRITNKICLTASKNTTFLQIKQKIEKMTQISVMNQFLSFCGNFMDDDQTLDSKKVSSFNALIIDNCQKIHQSSIVFGEGFNEIVEDKTITIQLNKENVSIKYSTVSDFTVKDVLKGYLRVENEWSYVLIFSNIIVYSNQKLKKLEESPQFEQPELTVIAIRNQKLSFLHAMGIQNEKIRTFSSIIFQDKQQFKNLNQTSNIKVKIPAQIVDRLQKAKDSILSQKHRELFKKQHFYLPFLLFSSRKFNQEIYRNIKNFDQYRADMTKQTSVFSIVRDLYCNLNWLKNYQKICHYGLRNFRASLFFKPENTFYFYNFTVAYEESKNVIEQLKGNAGTLFYIQSTSGKQIFKFSLFPQKKEIMFAPFTYFLVQRVKEGELYDEVWLTEIASPVTFRKNIMLWVDDNPDYNVKQYQVFLHIKKSIEILQVTSTKAAQKWIQQFGWILGWKGLKFKLISDMARTEWKAQKKIENTEAGIDLLQLLYKVKGYSNKTMIFCGNKVRALQKAESRNIPSQRYIIADNESQLEPYFQIQS